MSLTEKELHDLGEQLKAQQLAIMQREEDLLERIKEIEEKEQHAKELLKRANEINTDPAHYLVNNNSGNSNNNASSFLENENDNEGLTTDDIRLELERLKSSIAEINLNRIPNPINNSSNITVKDALSYVPIFKIGCCTASEFIRSCKRACSMLPLSLEPTFLALVRQKFTGVARSIVENMEYKSFFDFETQIRSAFGRHRTANQYKAELENIMMNKNEDMISYVNRVRALHSDILHAEVRERSGLRFDEKVKIEQDAISAFLKGIPPLLRVQCKFLPHNTLELAYENAILTYKNELTDIQRFGQSAANIAAVQNTEVQKTQIQKPNTQKTPTQKPQSTRQVARSQPTQQQPNQPTINLCVYCQRGRHDISDCWKKQNDERRANNPNNFNRNNFSNYPNRNNYNQNQSFNRNKFSNNYSNNYQNLNRPACEYCKRTGHDITNCFAFERMFKLRNDKMQSGNAQGPQEHAASFGDRRTQPSQQQQQQTQQQKQSPLHNQQYKQTQQSPTTSGLHTSN